MEIQQQIDADIKSAMLSGDKEKAEVLRGLKTALQYEAVELSAKDSGLTKEQAEKVLSKEAKKRADTAEVYENAGETERADKEKAEKQVIDAYLPEQANEDDVKAAVDGEFAKIDNPTAADTGKIIAAVRGQLGNNVDGGLIAKLIKEKLG